MASMHALFSAEVQWKSERIRRSKLPQKALEQPNWIGAYCAGNHNEFNNINAPLAALVLCDEGLVSLKPFGDRILGEAGALARFDHQPAKRSLLGSVDGFA
jgi:hypothetical protein